LTSWCRRLPHYLDNLQETSRSEGFAFQSDVREQVALKMLRQKGFELTACLWQIVCEHGVTKSA
jgi:hypothetical protein